MKNINKTIQFALCFLLLILISNNIFSQAPATVWSVKYAGASNAQDSVIAICSDPSGNIYVTGWSYVLSAYHYIVTIKYNPQTGDTLWVSRYTGSGTNIDAPIAITADNNACYITGYTFTASNNRDIVTIKYNSSTGAQQWFKTYNGTGNGGDYGRAIAVDNSGNVYVAGRTAIDGLNQKMIVIKYDASGNVVSGWPSIYTGSLSGAFDEAHAMQLDASGNIYITGVSGPSSSTGDYLTLMINSSGIVQWAKKYNGTSNGEDSPNALVLDATAQSVYVTGYATIYSQNQNYVTIKYNASTGDSLAAAAYNGPGNSSDIATTMTMDPSGNVYVSGYSWGGSYSSYATIKYNSNLVSQWVIRSTNAGNSYATQVAYSQGFVYVTGTFQGSGTGYDYLTCRYDASTGALKWAKTENGSSSGNDWGIGMVVTDTNNVFVTGAANFGTLDFYTLRYTEPVGIIPISHNVPKNFALSQNYPNPFNPGTTIRFDVAKSSFVNLSVYDILGREVTTLVNEQVPVGTYEVKWNPAGNSSGIYFYKMITSGMTLTKKMIFNK